MSAFSAEHSCVSEKCLSSTSLMVDIFCSREIFVMSCTALNKGLSYGAECGLG